MKRAIAAAASGLIGIVSVACSGGNPPTAQGSCPYVQAACPGNAAPSYKADVQPILAARCYGCHAPGGVGASRENLTTYRGVAQADIFGAVSTCRMPPADAGPLTLEQRTTLFDWNACGKPDN